MPGAIRNKVRDVPGAIIDVGCGRGTLFKSLRTARNQLAVGVDIYRRDVEDALGNGIYDDVVVADVRFLPFRTRTFDVVLCSELIEHLEKQDGFQLIECLQSISRKLLIIITPIGFYPQRGTIDNPHQEHISSWEPEEMSALGFVVSAVGFRAGGILFSRLPTPAKALAENLLYPLVEIITGFLLRGSSLVARDMVCTKFLDGTG